MRPLTIGLLFSSFIVFAQSQHPDLSGTWLGEKKADMKWTFSEKDDSIHFLEMNGDKVESDFTCPLDGQECKAKVEGHTQTITLYFNGDKLVEICEGHRGTEKRRFSVSPDGKTLSVEIIPMSSGSTETILFHKQAT